MRCPRSAILLAGIAMFAAIATGCAGEPKRPGPNPLAPVYAKALGGDVRAALLALDQVPVDSLDRAQIVQRECFLRTFSEKKPAPVTVRDPFVAELIGIYRDYWMRVLLQELDVRAGEDYLFARLGSYLGDPGHAAKADTLDALVEELGVMLRSKGFYSIRGVTSPYYELMVWGRETTRTYDVQLPEATIPVKVVFMDDFAVLGWSAFATCGKAYSGGWAAQDALYSVADAYDTASETFSVSYLAHEAQHFADYKKFPRLEQPELEYRAKLVELATAGETARALVANFSSQTGESRSAPHNFANLKVATDLSRSVLGSEVPVLDDARWARVPVKDINDAAAALLKSNTRVLDSLGAATVTRVLE